MASCAVSGDLLTWKDPMKTGIVFASGNAALLALWLDLPVVAYILMYGGFLALLAGFAAKFMLKKDSMKFSEILPQEKYEEASKCLYKQLDCAFNAAAPILFWQNIQLSGLAGLILYVATLVMQFFSIATIAILGFNGLFVYGKFQVEIDTALGPHIAVVKEQAGQYLKMIPMYEKKE